MINEKSDIIAQYNQLKKYLGHQPSAKEFYKNTSVSQRALQNFYGANAWNKFVEQCGGLPKVFNTDKTDFNEVLIQYGNLFRELKRHPPAAEWDYRKYTPTISGIVRTHDTKWSEMPQKFKDFAYGQIEWQDVIELIPKNNSISQVGFHNNTEKLTLQVQNYTPPIIQDLIELSYNDSKFDEFEKKVNIVFEMLGFEVKHFGQGTGRKPDGIALSKTNPRYAILIDSKSRGEGYKFGTDDRAFVEYIKTYVSRLQNDGYDKLYFVVVSSKFISIPETSVKRLSLETHVPITFLSSHLLLKILSKKIEKPRIFDLDKFRALLIDSGEISETKINTFFNDLNKSQTI